jgi:hypothetical protein
MSQTIKTGVPTKILVKNRNPGTISTGGNTEVYINGQRVSGISYLKLEFKPAKVTKVVLEMYAEVEVEEDIAFASEMPKTDTVKIGGQIYTLTEYSTMGIAESPKKET